jgi:hypothetical protein
MEVRAVSCRLAATVALLVSLHAPIAARCVTHRAMEWACILPCEASNESVIGPSIKFSVERYTCQSLGAGAAVGVSTTKPPRRNSPRMATPRFRVRLLFLQTAKP